MRIIVVFGFIFFCAPAFAQSVPGSTNKAADTLLQNVYLGDIYGTLGKVSTRLVLEHAGKYVDDGHFILVESFPDGEKTTKGDWTVLRGDAKNRNATVVELYSAQRTLYFLRRKDGVLQKLDSSLREITPAGNYLLRKIGKTKK